MFYTAAAVLPQCFACLTTSTTALYRYTASSVYGSDYSSAPLMPDLPCFDHIQEQIKQQRIGCLIKIKNNTFAPSTISQ
jgi:hypothetical protein